MPNHSKLAWVAFSSPFDLDDMFSIPHESDVMVDRSTELQLQALPVDEWKYRQDHLEHICTEVKKQKLEKQGPYFAYCQLKVHLENMQKHSRGIASLFELIVEP